MKKTFITLLALAGVAMGDTAITGSSLTWDTSSPYKDCTTVTNGDLHYAGGGWWVSGPTGSLTESIILGQDQKLEFSFTCSFYDKDHTDEYGDRGSNSILTMALVSNTNGAVVMGKSYSDDIYLGSTAEIGDAVSRGYAFANTNNGDNVAEVTDKGALGESFTKGEDVANQVSFTVVYDTTKSQFVGTLIAAGKKAEIDLGTTFEVNAITATFDGDSHYVADVKDISLTVTKNIPEPATATLSLLALAALCARRRRA